MILDGQGQTKTDRNGRFRFRRVARGPHSVEVKFTHDAPFFFTTASRVEAMPDTDLSFGIGFSLGRLFGTVKNDAGAPLNDLVVRISTPEREWTARTAGQGRFALEGLPAGVYDVRIDPASVPPGYNLDGLNSASVRVEPAAPGRVLLTLHAQRTISGAVRMYVACAGAYARVSGAIVKGPNGEAHTTDQEGRFVFRDMPAGVHTLVAEHEALAGTTEVTLADGPATLRDVVLSLRERSSGGSGQCAETP